MIRSISIDKFGDVDSLQLQLQKFHNVDVSSGGDSLLTMLLALSQSFLPGYAYDWQNVARPGDSGFGNGRLAVRGKLFDGGRFARCLGEGSSYCSGRIEFVIENPENPVEGYADRKRAGADDFRELCRLFGEKFANVRRFALGIETSFAKKSDNNILSYQMVSVCCERVWDEDITGFFELVLYRNGTNYDLYWDELPDIRGTRTSGRAKGCNVRMRNLAVLDIVSDGVQDGARFEEVLPSVVRISRIAADQFATLRFLDVESRVEVQEPCCHVGVQMAVQEPGCHVGVQLPAQGPCSYVISQAPTQGPCYYVGAHGEYTDAVVRTYTEEKIRVAWPDPETGKIRHGLFEEAYEAWKNKIGSALLDESENKTGSPRLDRTWAEGAALVQGLILRTGETLVISGNAGLPDKFFDFLSCMGRQIVQVT